MAGRLSYALPVARQLLLSWGRRLRPGGLSRALPRPDGRPFIIVTGTGRSGTSAIARVLHESGLSMGTSFRTPTGANPVGFYEELPVCDLNDAMIAEAGGAELRRWPSRSTVLTVAGRYGAQMDALVAKSEAAGWKDPRFAVTLEAWLPHLPSPPKLVICLRSSEAYLHSVMESYGLLSRELVERWWANELRRLLALVRDYRLETTCVDYDDLLQWPEEIIDSLSRFAGHPLDPAYVQPDLRHFSYGVPPRFGALYAEVRALGPARERPAAPDVETYIERVRDLDGRVQAAKSAWSGAVGEPPRLANQAPGQDAASLFDEARAASDAYAGVLSAAQAELGALRPPEGFEHYHEATRAAVDDQRLVAQMTLQAARGERSTDDIMPVYQLRLSPAAVAKAQRRRAREYERAMKRSGRKTPSSSG